MGGRQVKVLSTGHTEVVEIHFSPRMPREDRCVCKVHDAKAAPVQVAMVFHSQRAAKRTLELPKLLRCRSLMDRA